MFFPDQGPHHRPRRCWRSVALPLGIAGALVGAAGCGREDIQVYRAPKEVPPSAPRAAEDSAPSGSAQVRWQLPQGWRELPAGQMRVGYFAVDSAGGQKAEVTIIPLPGLAGSDLDNVNRWRAQIGLGPIDAEALAQAAEKVSVGGSDGQLFDLVGPEGQAARKRMLAAISRREGIAWFFKMTGDAELVGNQKPTFVEFLKSLDFNPESSAAPQTAAATPSPQAGSGDPPASAGRPTFTVPPGWKEQPPGSMQLAKYVPEGAEGKVEITVARLPGDGGGRLANVNRWRRQLGQPPISEQELTPLLSPLEVPGAESYLVDLRDPASRRRMIAAGVARGGQSWFYKLAGDEQLVEREKAAFTQFVQSARYDP